MKSKQEGSARPGTRDLINRHAVSRISKAFQLFFQKRMDPTLLIFPAVFGASTQHCSTAHLHQLLFAVIVRQQHNNSNDSGAALLAIVSGASAGRPFAFFLRLVCCLLRSFRVRRPPHPPLRELGAEERSPLLKSPIQCEFLTVCSSSSTAAAIDGSLITRRGYYGGRKHPSLW